VEIKLGQYVFDRDLNIYIITDKKLSYIKITKIGPKTQNWKSYSVYKNELFYINNHLWELVI